MLLIPDGINIRCTDPLLSIDAEFSHSMLEIIVRVEAAFTATSHVVRRSFTFQSLCVHFLVHLDQVLSILESVLK